MTASFTSRPSSWCAPLRARGEHSRLEVFRALGEGGFFKTASEREYAYFVYSRHPAWPYCDRLEIRVEGKAVNVYWCGDWRPSPASGWYEWKPPRR